MESSDDTLELGGNIRLAGFRELDGASMIVVKKIVGSYARKISELIPNVTELSLVLKPVHKVEESSKYEIKGRLVVGGEHYNSEYTDKNLFVALDKVLKKVESMVQKH